MVSRPLVLGPILGALLGDPWLGAAMGVLVELFSLDVLPVGNVIPVNSSVAVASMLLWGTRSPEPVALPLAFPAGLAAGWVYGALEGWLRARRSAWSLAVEGEIQAGLVPALGGRIAWGLAAEAGMCALYLLVQDAALGALLAAAWRGLPGVGREALGAAFGAAPWLGLAALVACFLRK